jgi:hypothetical protein
MKMFGFVFAAALVAVGLTTGLAADKPKPEPTVGLVQASLPQKQVQANVGDLIELSLDFPVVPGRMVSSLVVDAQGGLAKVGVARITKRTPGGQPIVGVGNIAAFLKATKAGPAIVRITADDQGQTVYEVMIVVKAGDAN